MHLLAGALHHHFAMPADPHHLGHAARVVFIAFVYSIRRRGMGMTGIVAGVPGDQESQGASPAKPAAPGAAADPEASQI